MTATRGLALFMTVAVAAALRAAGPDVTATSPRLKSVSSRVGSKGASLTIEATEPALDLYFHRVEQRFGFFDAVLLDSRAHGIEQVLGRGDADVGEQERFFEIVPRLLRDAGA